MGIGAPYVKARMWLVDVAVVVPSITWCLEVWGTLWGNNGQALPFPKAGCPFSWKILGRGYFFRLAVSMRTCAATHIFHESSLGIF